MNKIWEHTHELFRFSTRSRGKDYINVSLMKKNMFTKSSGFLLKEISHSEELGVPLNPLTVRKKRCFYHSKERGMLENDLLLGSFSDKYLEHMSEILVSQYEALLQQPDPDVFHWITRKEKPPHELDNEILKMLQQHCDENPMNYHSV